MIQRFGAQTITPSGSRFAVMLNRSVVVCKLDGPAGDESESLASFAHESNIAGISLVADGSRLITLDQLGVVREWDLTPPPRMVHAFDRVRFNADGSRRFYYPRYSAATTTIPLRIVDRSEREVGDRLAPLSAGHAHGPAASADGRTQAITWHPNQGECLLVAWDLATGRERCRVKLGPGIWEELAVSPDGERAALLGSPPEMAGKPRTPQFARIMDLNTGKVVWSSETRERRAVRTAWNSIPAGATSLSPRAATPRATTGPSCGTTPRPWPKQLASRWARKTSPSPPFLATGILLQFASSRGSGTPGAPRTSASFPWRQSFAANRPRRSFSSPDRPANLVMWRSVPMGAGSWRRATGWSGFGRRLMGPKC